MYKIRQCSRIELEKVYDNIKWYNVVRTQAKRRLYRTTKDNLLKHKIV